MKARLFGGPYDGVVIEIANPMEEIGLGVDDLGRPDKSKPPIGLAVYKRQKVADGTTLYELLGFKRALSDRDGESKSDIHLWCSRASEQNRSGCRRRAGRR